MARQIQSSPLLTGVAIFRKNTEEAVANFCTKTAMIPTPSARKSSTWPRPNAGKGGGLEPGAKRRRYCTCCLIGSTTHRLLKFAKVILYSSIGWCREGRGYRSYHLWRGTSIVSYSVFFSHYFPASSWFPWYIVFAQTYAEYINVCKARDCWFSLLQRIAFSPFCPVIWTRDSPATIYYRHEFRIFV